MLKQFGAFFILFFFSLPLFGQDNPDFMRSIGKIYVVVAVLLAIFVGIIVFLIYLERKISQLEKHSNHSDNE